MQRQKTPNATDRPLMMCDKCNVPIPSESIYEFRDKKVCDDCYIDLIIGVPPVDISKLSPEIQSRLHGVMKNWHRNRPNRHQIKFPKQYPGIDEKGRKG